MQCGQQVQQLPLIVVAGKGPSLLGRDWLARLKLDWTRIWKMDARDHLHEVLERHAPVFSPGLGKVRGVEVKLQADPQALPKFHHSPCGKGLRKNWTGSKQKE